jgi:DNA ligase (NAD+)
VDLVCANPQCSGKLINQLDHFCGIKGLNIKGLSKATLEKLIDWGRVTSYVDIFLLHSYAAEWAQKPGFGEKSVEKILNAIEEAKHCDLASFISALGIPLIGRAVSKDIAAKVDNYWQFRKLIENNYDFTQWDGFGEEKKNSLLKYDYCYADYVVQQGFVIIQEPCLDEPVNQGLSGKTFVITGKLNHYKNRNLLKEEIEKLGGKVTDSISAKTSYLINNDINSASSKNKKAKELNIPIITEEDFISMKNF